MGIKKGQYRLPHKNIHLLIRCYIFCRAHNGIKTNIHNHRHCKQTPNKLKTKQLDKKKKKKGKFAIYNKFP